MQDKEQALLAEQFPLEEGLCYLNHAAVSPWPKIASEALKRFAEENTLAGATHYPKWMEQERQLRQGLAKLLQISTTHEIALAKSTSEALSIIAYGLSWESGDEVIISNQEFPSNRIVWESLASQGVKTVVADIESDNPINSILSRVTPKTKLVSVSTVQYASGLRIDWEALSGACRQKGILLCLDAIQSLGALSFNQARTQADFIVADGHKWMMGAEGLALLYVKEKLINTLNLHQYGWHMIAHRGDYDRKEWSPAKDATRFECGSPNMLGTHVLNASLGLLLEIGIERVEALMEKKVDYLIERLQELKSVEILSPIEKKRRAGIVSFRFAGLDHKALHKSLMEDSVICAYRGGGIRWSPAFYTPFDVIDQAIERLKMAIEASLAKG